MKRILYVLHSGVTGGTFLTNKDLMKNVENEYEIYLLGAEKDYFRLYSFKNKKLIIIKDYSRHVKLNVTTNNSNQEYHYWNVKEFHNSWLAFIYFDILIKYNIDIVHIRHLINHSFDLPYISKKLGIPTILSIHDFYFICPFYTLLDENKKYCKGVCNNNPENCYCPMNSLNNINSKKFIPEWRKNVMKMFLNIDFFITTSDIVKKIFLDIYGKNIINNDNFFVIEHGRDFPKINKKLYEIPTLEKPIKILCPANHINIMKGSELIKEIKKEDKEDLLEFHFLGNCHDNIENYGINHGTFERDDFYKKVEMIKPSYIGIFSIWPETFCHTLTEAWSCGIPVIGTNIGVIQDRIIKNNGGLIIDRENPKNAYLDILNLSNDVNNYLNLVKSIENIQLESTRTMSEKYLKIYDGLTKNNSPNESN